MTNKNQTAAETVVLGVKHNLNPATLDMNSTFPPDPQNPTANQKYNTL